MVDLEYFESAKEIFVGKEDQVSIGTICMPGLQIIPTSLNQTDVEGQELLGLKFRENQAEALVYCGSEKLFDNFVLPNIGLDMPLHFMSTETF